MTCQSLDTRITYACSQSLTFPSSPTLESETLYFLHFCLIKVLIHGIKWNQWVSWGQPDRLRVEQLWCRNATLQFSFQEAAVARQSQISVVIDVNRKCLSPDTSTTKITRPAWLPLIFSLSGNKIIMLPSSMCTCFTWIKSGNIKWHGY